jgi:tetratricopeptide (TPR) repeat protein
VTNVDGPMRAAAAKAIALDPNLSEAHAAMALINVADWDWAGAEQEARHAIALNPDVVSPLAILLHITGRHAEAIALSEHAVKLNPLSAEAHRGYGNTLYWARKYEDAVSRLKLAIDLEPRSTTAMSILGSAYEALGRPQEALAVFDRPEFRESPQIAEVYARLGRREDALRVLNGLVKRGGGSTFKSWRAPISRWATRTAASSGSPRRSTRDPDSYQWRMSTRRLTASATIRASRRW